MSGRPVAERTQSQLVERALSIASQSIAAVTRLDHPQVRWHWLRRIVEYLHVQTDLLWSMPLQTCKRCSYGHRLALYLYCLCIERKEACWNRSLESFAYPSTVSMSSGPSGALYFYQASPARGLSQCTCWSPRLRLGSVHDRTQLLCWRTTLWHRRLGLDEAKSYP